MATTTGTDSSKQKSGWGMIVAIAGGIVVLGTAMSTIDEYRWWATRTELQTVAGVTYGEALARQRSYLVELNLLIAKCQADTNCDRVSLKNLLEQKEGIMAEMKRLEAEEKNLRE